MNEKDQVQSSAQLIQKDLGLEAEFDLGSVVTVDRLEMELTRVVRYLLDHDFNRLLNALYRIDVGEGTVKQILELALPEEVAPGLARAILTREMQKVALRQKYSGSE
ncbi:MAG: hypothetical protein OEY56_13710 [Cyclobacteriaceae bacterium]|nr:hypothetical protein [Cyclobacteriaceae bacterium]